MRSQHFVRSLLIIRNAKRSIILVICTVSLLAELPRLAVYFRDPQYLRTMHMMPDAPGKRAAAVEHAGVQAFAPMREPVVQPSSPGSTQQAHDSGQTKPSQSLLTALRETKPDARDATARNGAAINLQAAQDVINGRVPATPAVHPEEGVLSEGYLPPWDALRGREAAQSFASRSGNGAGLTMPVSVPRADVRRMSRRHAYASARRRRFSSSPFGGFFGF